MRFEGWWLTASGVLVLGGGLIQLIAAGAQRLDLFMVPGLLGSLLIAWGAAELRGVLSRRRWRRARAQVELLSTQSAVCWRHDRFYLVLCLIWTLPMCGIALSSLAWSAEWVFGSAMLLLSLYFTLIVSLNKREIVRDGDAFVYSSRPIRHLFDRVRCTAPRFVQVRPSRVGHEIVVVCADSSSVELAAIVSEELAITVSRAIDASLLGASSQGLFRR